MDSKHIPITEASRQVTSELPVRRYPLHHSLKKDQITLLTLVSEHMDHWGAWMECATHLADVQEGQEAWREYVEGSE